MKILIFSPKFYPSIGGLEILIHSLAVEFSKKGHQVVIISNSGSIEKYKLPFIVINQPGFYKIFSEYLKCDIYFMPNLSLKGVWPYLLFPFKKWVISHNNCYVSGFNKQTWYDFLKLALMYLGKNISVSKYISTKIWCNSTVIYNCYREDIFFNQHLSYRSNNILFVGRLVSDKGIDILLKACKKLWEKNFTFKVTIVGDGPMKNWVFNFINEFNLENRVYLLGTVQNDKLAKLMNEHLILAVPSYNEPFGIVALEGLACGCKVIVSDSGALKEAVNDFGFTFISGDVHSLKNIILKCLFDQEKAHNDEYKNILAKYLKNYTVSVVAEKYLAIFDK